MSKFKVVASSMSPEVSLLVLQVVTFVLGPHVAFHVCSPVLCTSSIKSMKSQCGFPYRNLWGPSSVHIKAPGQNQRHSVAVPDRIVNRPHALHAWH